MALVLFSVLWLQDYSNAQEVVAAPVTTQNHQIGDDGWSNVPLQFNFPFYGQNFNNSWLYSNGAIGFVNPNQGGLGGNNLSVREFTNNMGSQFNYTIYPMWTDLINLSGTFQTEGSADFQRYKWIGISPYADGNRFNTFTVEIKPNGQINVNYSLVNVNYATIGLIGDASKGEYEQIYRFNGGVNTGMVSDWSRYTSVAVDPCIENPTASSSCPGYAQALLSQIANVLPAATEVATTTSPASQAEPVQENTASSSALAAAVQQSSSEPQAAEPVATAEQKQEQSGEKKGASLSTILSIVGKEQSRIAAVEQSVVSESVSQAMKDADRMTADAEAVAQQSSSQSQEQASTEPNNNQTQTATVQQASVQTTVSAASLAARSGPAEQRAEEKKEEQTSQQDQDTSSQVRPNRQDDSAQAIVQQNQNMEPPKPQVIVQDSQPQQQMDISILVPVQNMQTESQTSQGAVEMKQPDPIKMEETQAPVQVLAVEQRPVSSQPIATAPQQETSVPSLIPPSLADPLRIEAVIQDSLPTNYSLIPERRVVEEIEMPRMEEYKAVTTNPAEDFKDSKPPVMEQQQQSQGQQVKSNVQDNEAAGGVSLDRMAVQPAGYAQYSIALKDAAFYEPKEIYKGQKVVDNARALRQLATDKLHQEMVEQQYRR